MKSQFQFVNLPFERGEILFSKGFFDFTDIRKLQAEISNLFAKLYYFEQRCENATVGLWRISGHTGGMRTMRTGCTKDRLLRH